jgi:hypothetical protein
MKRYQLILLLLLIAAVSSPVSKADAGIDSIRVGAFFISDYSKNVPEAFLDRVLDNFIHTLSENRDGNFGVIERHLVDSILKEFYRNRVQKGVAYDDSLMIEVGRVYTVTHFLFIKASRQGRYVRVYLRMVAGKTRNVISGARGLFEFEHLDDPHVEDLEVQRMVAELLQNWGFMPKPKPEPKVDENISPRFGSMETEWKLKAGDVLEFPIKAIDEDNDTLILITSSALKDSVSRIGNKEWIFRYSSHCEASSQTLIMDFIVFDGRTSADMSISIEIKKPFPNKTLSYALPGYQQIRKGGFWTKTKGVLLASGVVASVWYFFDQQAKKDDALNRYWEAYGIIYETEHQFELDEAYNSLEEIEDEYKAASNRRWLAVSGLAVVYILNYLDARHARKSYCQSIGEKAQMQSESGWKPFINIDFASIRLGVRW